MSGMNFPRLPPGAIGNDELNRRSLLHDQCPVQLHGIIGGIKQKCPILRGYKISQVESFSAFTSYAHFAVYQCFDREQAGIAAARQFSVMYNQTNPGAQCNSRNRAAQTHRPRSFTDRTRLSYFSLASQLEGLIQGLWDFTDAP